RYRRCRSVAVFSHFASPATNEEIEIRSLVGLHDVTYVESPITGLRELGRRPFLAAPLQFVLGDFQVQTPCLDVQLDDIAVAHQGYGAASRCLRRRMKNDRAKCRSTHASIGDAY